MMSTSASVAIIFEPDVTIEKANFGLRVTKANTGQPNVLTKHLGVSCVTKQTPRRHSGEQRSTGPAGEILINNLG